MPSRQAKCAQRQSLLYLAFPDFFLPIVVPGSVVLIRDAFAPRVSRTDPVDDVDDDLHNIYEAIMDQQGGPVDFYASPWLKWWQR